MLFLFLLYLWLLPQIAQGRGYLSSPVSRSYALRGTESLNRAFLVNAWPCGGTDFEQPQSIPKDPGNSIGDTLAVKFIPIYVPSPNTTFEYWVCKQTSKFQNCRQLDRIIHQENPIAGFSTNSTQSLTTEIIINSGLKCDACTFVWIWRLSDYETLYNCADVEIHVSGDETPDEWNTALPTPTAEQDQGVPEGSCCVSEDSKKNLALVGAGQNCKGSACGVGQCCKKGVKMCGPYSAGSGVYMDNVKGDVMDGMMAQQVFCARSSTDFRYTPCDEEKQSDFFHTCSTCTLSDPSKCTSKYRVVSGGGGSPDPVEPSCQKGEGKDEEKSSLTLLFIISLIFGVAVAAGFTWKYYKENVLESEGTKTLLENNERSEDYQAPSNEDLVPLPKGWQAYKDEEGNDYFYNQATNETTWNDPRTKGTKKTAAL